MLWAPAASDAVVNVATPDARGAVPMAAPPSLNVTVPVGVPPALVTVAVNVIARPGALGLAEEASDAVVADVTLTVCVNTGEVLPAKLPSPL
jgi:hypothetical protein